MPSVSLYKTGVLETLHNFLPMLQAREKPPTPEQARVVTAVIKRLRIEYDEQQPDYLFAVVINLDLVCHHRGVPQDPNKGGQIQRYRSV